MITISVAVHGPEGRDIAVSRVSPPPTSPHNVANLSEFFIANAIAATLRGGEHVRPGERLSIFLARSARFVAFACTVLLMGSAGSWGDEPAGTADRASVPGVVVDHQPARTRQYIGSPSIAILPDGSFVASHDIFGPGSTCSRTRVFGSRDGGKTWQHLSDIDGAFWSTLFVHRGALYLIGASSRYGNVVIRRSDDGGRTWTTPKNEKSGLLLADTGYHCAPQPVLVHAGRIWRAMEDKGGPGAAWGKHFRAFMMSAPVDADLLRADSWTVSNRLARDPKWLGGKFGGWLEGNAVLAPDGRVINILRVEYPSGGGKAAIVEVSDDAKTVSFHPETGFIDLPGGCTKFTIRFDPVSKYYWSLTNYIPRRHRIHHPGATRNTLALVRSRDLRNWEVRSIVAHHPDVKRHGFQYVDWQFDGDDIVAVARTADDDGQGGAHNFHDANYLTFHRLTGFRDADDLHLPEASANSDQPLARRRSTGVMKRRPGVSRSRSPASAN